MKKAVLILALMLTSGLAFAQDAPVATPVAEPEAPEPKFTAAVDVVYPYLWRGLKYYGDKIAFQPYLSYAVTDKLSVGVWATTNFSNAADAYNEFDWSISYQISPVVKVMLSDYYWPATKNNQDWERSSYFDYSEGSAQSLDLSVLLDFSEKGVPLDFQWNTFIGGGDYKYDDSGERSRAFSSYAEIGYTYSLEKAGVDVRPFVGAAVINGGYYGADASGKSGFTFSNVGVNVAKELKITNKFSLPVFIRYTNNDYGIQQFDANDNLTKTVRNFFSAGVTFNIK
ncbi:TorF family putative porin [Flavobacterium sp. LB1P62]|uniref:TorF family putative porin n=1 Tax=unclassified Flavobacterium TaxID=196869 RepID=UPI003AAC976B